MHFVSFYVRESSYIYVIALCLCSRQFLTTPLGTMRSQQTQANAILVHTLLRHQLRLFHCKAFYYQTPCVPPFHPKNTSLLLPIVSNSKAPPDCLPILLSISLKPQFLVFLFSTFQLLFPRCRSIRLMSAFDRTLKQHLVRLTQRIVSYRVVSPLTRHTRVWSGLVRIDTAVRQMSLLLFQQQQQQMSRDVMSASHRPTAGRRVSVGCIIDSSLCTRRRCSLAYSQESIVTLRLTDPWLLRFQPVLCHRRI